MVMVTQKVVLLQRILIKFLFTINYYITFMCDTCILLKPQFTFLYRKWFWDFFIFMQHFTIKNILYVSYVLL